jgi:hypothetical protein
MLIWVALAGIGIGVVVFAGLLRTAVRWGNEMIELKQFGVETTGTVLKKRSHASKTGHSRSLQYEYRDQFGEPHTRTVLVTSEAWESLQEGGAIEVIYSQRRPKVSAPKYLIDALNTAKVTITVSGRE